MAKKVKKRRKNWRLQAGNALEFPPQVVAGGLGFMFMTIQPAQ